MKKKPKKRPRTKKRELERAIEKLEDDKEKLARLEEGGTPEWPIEVPSASIIETRALGLGCARCDGALKLEDHAAVALEGRLLRRVRAQCNTCYTRREVWLRITHPN